MFERIFRVAKENNVVVATLRELVYTRYIRSNISIILFSAEQNLPLINLLKVSQISETRIISVHVCVANPYIRYSIYGGIDP